MGSPAHTNPLNLDPVVKEAYSRFYLLDFPGAIERFERFHAAHPGDPHATALLLDAMVFQELYRLDLLDTTFYANDGFLTGRHAEQEDPKMRDRIFALADEVVREADSRVTRTPTTSTRCLRAAGRSACVAPTSPWSSVGSARGSGWPPRPGMTGAGSANRSRLRRCQAGHGVYEYVVGALPFPFKFVIGFAGITGSKTKGMEMLHDAANRAI